ncbi:nuclear protein localization protein 4 [Nematocida sp. LUAm3]|nr:nuclear protein localization protein 4 [Nematocida sp. LUAm3]KAI5175392.1 nuclear protein localization protein 4 [Nematocida sp. LUAm2]KAI5177651.1 nuclear protein localization protein 4 [Nematocida sp. LUAm1]
MIVRVHGKDRIMNIEVPEEASVDALKEKINERTGSICTSLLLAGKAIVQGTLLSNGIEHGVIVQAVYDVLMQQEEEKEEEKKEVVKRSASCSHPSGGMCSSCAPEDSWLSDSFQNRRFLSQGAYEEFLASKDKTLQIESHLPPRCRTHGPDARCNKCLPKEITITSQIFRPVDHIEIDDRTILERLVSERKGSQKQVIYLLVGRYSEYSEVAKGVKAKVFGTLPIEYTGLKDGMVLNPNDDILCGKDASVRRVLSELNMEIVGMVFTRISEEKLSFISSLELLFIAAMQNRFPHMVNEINKGSRFVTLIISGTEGESEIIELCATNFAMELLYDGVVFASSNPGEVIVEPITAVWTGKEGATTGHTIPVEYLVVRPTHGLTSGNGLFSSDTLLFKRGSGVSGVKKHFQKKITDSSIHGLSLRALSDLQLLIELADMNALPDTLISVILTQDEQKFTQSVLNGEFNSIVDLAKDCIPPEEWICQTCTLMNSASVTSCDACGLPKS